MFDSEADFVVVGAGSAGCVVAARLTEDHAAQVTLLEAGGWDRNPWIHVPVGFFKTIFNPNLTWGYRTDPIPGLDDRVMIWPRGKVIGGSSSINGLLYTRGQPQDYDQWRQFGNVGWSYEDMLPYFRKSENNERGASEFHGADGGLAVSDLPMEHRLHDAFIDASRAAGHPFNPDFNAERQDGVGTYQLTERGGWRCSAAAAFLKPARKRSNLRIETRALATRVLFEGKRAVGVEYRQGEKTRRIRARREVVLCGGAINSPQLLMLSGIGPAGHLLDNGIEVLSDLPGVGENMQDHLTARMIFKMAVPTLNDDYRALHRRAWMGLQWLFASRGPLTMGAGPIGLFARTRPDIDTPDVQYAVFVSSADKAGDPFHDFSGLTVAACPLRPESRGHLRLRSADPAEHPSIQPNYLATEGDRQVVAESVRIIRRIFQTPVMQPLVAEEIGPGEAAQSDEEILAYIRQRVGTAFHPIGTCKMGPDPMAVVDDSLRVRGVDRLRVIDASIMPTMISGNTNAPTIAIGEKGADLLRAA